MASKKTGMRCSVKFCDNKASSQNLSFFSYPKDKDRLTIWTKNCETEHLADALTKSNNYRVCAAHFDSKMFLNPTTKSRLVFNAVPTLFSGKLYF